MNRHERRKAEKLGKQNNNATGNIAVGNPEKLVLQQALQLHQQNKLAEAEVLYRQILTANPSQPDALYLLGVIASQVGQYPIAEELISQSLKIKPDNIDAHLNLGNVYQAQQRFAEAEQSFKRALKYNPNIPEIWFNLGNSYDLQGKHVQAIESFKKAISLKKGWADPYIHLGLSLKSMNQHEEAINAFKQSLAIDHNNYQALYNLANLLQHMKRFEEADSYCQKALAIYPAAEIFSMMGVGYGEQGKWDEALQHHQKAVALKPNDVGILNNLGNAYGEQQNSVEAENIYRQAIAIDPSFAKTYFNLGCLYQDQELLDQAEAEYIKALSLNPKLTPALLNLGIVCKQQNNLTRALEYNLKALEIIPDYADAHSNLANIYQEQGRIIDAMEHYKRAFLACSDHAVAHSNYLFAMHYDPQTTPQEIHRESLAWGARHADAHLPLEHLNDSNQTRRLRVGYVSADLRKHPVVTYLEPVLKFHDKSQVEIFCYANQPKDDEVTERLKSYADHWRNIFKLSDAAAAEQIQKDKIDILIDLSGHTAGNRLLIFARKPAPLQATWIGYFNTTGVKAIDYIITDRFLLPPEEEHLYVEKPLRLPNSGALLFKPYDLLIEVNGLPATTNGYFTFGCFNNLSKLTPEILGIWAEILKRVPNSKLYLKNKSFSDPIICDQYRVQFVALGVAAERLLFSGHSPVKEYLEAFHEIDLGLDPFPYNGATTTLESLWMGVPLVAIKGDRMVSHFGESLLGAVGLEEFIATTKAEYVEKAVAFANNLPRLVKIRCSLRQTLMAAPITNPDVFIRGLEDAFRDIWKKWCETK